MILLPDLGATGPVVVRQTVPGHDRPVEYRYPSLDEALEALRADHDAALHLDQPTVDLVPVAE